MLKGIYLPGDPEGLELGLSKWVAMDDFISHVGVCGRYYVRLLGCSVETRDVWCYWSEGRFLTRPAGVSCYVSLPDNVSVSGVLVKCD